MGSQQQESKTIPLKMLVDKQRNKVVFVEATKDFLDTLFSFLSLPLGTIVRLLATNNNNDQQQQSESSPFLKNIKHLYQSVQNITTNDVWNNPFCKEMLLSPRNPCESLCMKLFLNIDDTEPSSKFFVCDSCYTFTTFRNLHCTCGKPTNRQPQNLDIEGQDNDAQNGVFNRETAPVFLVSDEEQDNDAQNGVFVRESAPLFLVSDDLKIVSCSFLSSMQMLIDSGYAHSNQLEEVTHNIGKNEDVISKSHFLEKRIALNPRSLNGSKEGVIGFVKRSTLYGIGDDLKVKPLSANYFLSYLKELSLPIDDLEVKMISIGEAEALNFLGAFLTSRFTLTSGLKDLLNVPTQESTFLKLPKKESIPTSK